MTTKSTLTDQLNRDPHKGLNIYKAMSEPIYAFALIFYSPPFYLNIALILQDPLRMGCARRQRENAKTQ